MRWFHKAIIAGVLSGAGLCGGACLPPPDATEAPDPALADVIYEGNATAPALQAMLRESPITSTELGPSILNPPNDMILDARSPVTFTWSPHGTTASIAPSPMGSTAHAEARTGAPVLASAAISETNARAVAGRPLLDLAPAPERSAWPAWLAELVGPERTASAGSVTLSGNAYFLAFSTPKSPRLLRVFTSETSYTPDAAAWKTLAGAGMWTKLIVLGARFQSNMLIGGTGPYEGAEVQFCIEAPASP